MIVDLRDEKNSGIILAIRNLPSVYCQQHFINEIVLDFVARTLVENNMYLLPRSCLLPRSPPAAPAWRSMGAAKKHARHGHHHW